MIAIDEYVNHEIVGSMTTVFGDDFHLMPHRSLLGLASALANFQLYYDAGAAEFAPEAISDILPDWINPDQDSQTGEILINKELCHHLIRIEQEMYPNEQLKLLDGIISNFILEPDSGLDVTQFNEAILNRIKNLDSLQKKQVLAVLTNCQNYYCLENNMADIASLAAQDVVPDLADEDPELLELIEIFSNEYSEEEQLIIISTIAQSLIAEQDGVIQKIRADFLANFVFAHKNSKENDQQLFTKMAENGVFDRFLMHTPREEWGVQESEPKVRGYYNYSF